MVEDVTHNSKNEPQFVFEDVNNFPFKMSSLVEAAEEDEKEIDDALTKCVDDIWENYDTDKNGVISYEEGRKLIKDVMFESGITNISEKLIRQAFEEFDADGSGELDK